MSGGYDLSECLDAIDPRDCTYDEWARVGMALHAEGRPMSEWDSWSRRDAARYHEGECGRKWASFGRSPSEVKGGTIVEMARGRGWSPARDEGHELSWDGSVEDNRIVDPSWVEPAETDEPGGEWEGWRDLMRYLDALFEPGETVGYVVGAFCRDGRWVPSGRGNYDRTAGELMDALAKYRGDLGSSIGEPNAQAGAWVRFNPLDGRGVRNENVAEFRYALVESDELDVGRQRAIIDELELPCAAIVHSGNKSLHAIVHVDAADYAEYRRRVDFLYRVCEDNGLKVDTANKNPSRLSRMPGVTRNGRKQWLVATNAGKPDWDSWKEWVDEVNDDLPEPESLADVWGSLPELAPPLIDGVLRQGHKMLLAGPSKAGKSFALIELCVAIAEGVPWMGFSCARGRVLYVNLELDRASCLHRFADVYAALGIEPTGLSNIDVWNLRGKSKPMDRLAPALIRRALKTRPIAVVIDPIYKVITGDENSAEAMAAFCNQFDRIAAELGCAVVYCHHHSKGAQGAKRSMDRSSGSGVFSRDPDAILDLIELHRSDDMVKAAENGAVCRALAAWLAEEKPGWERDVSQDDTVVADAFLEDARKMCGTRAEEKSMLDAVYAARKRARQATAWRVEGTLREFPAFDPLDLWFTYPLHVRDASGMLADAPFEGDWRAAEAARAAGRAKGNKASANKRKDEQRAKVALVRDAMDACAADGVAPTRAAVLERIGEWRGKEVTMKTLKAWTQRNKANNWTPITVGDGDVLVDSEQAALEEGW